jgi:hypothetical protein
MATLEGLYFVIASRALIGVILLAAGALKLPAPAAFARVIAGFKLLPRAFHRPLAYLLPSLECAIGAFLLFSIWSSHERLTSWASVFASVLFMIFAMAIAINLLRGRREISCGCFGVRESDQIGWGLVLRNLCLSALALFSLPSSWTGMPVPNSSYRTMDAMLLGVSTLLLWLLLRAIFQMRRYQQNVEV